jgi:hypothetical protein
MRPLPVPDRSARSFNVKAPMISQSGEVLPSPKPLTDSLLATEMMWQNRSNNYWWKDCGLVRKWYRKCNSLWKQTFWWNHLLSHRTAGPRVYRRNEKKGLHPGQKPRRYWKVHICQAQRWPHYFLQLGEDVYNALSRTQAGRYLSVFYIKKLGSRALIISVRDMLNRERKRYGKK